jgi:thiol-disulfide isomerase/thioredoxin
MDKILKITAALVVVVFIGCAAVFFTGIQTGIPGVLGTENIPSSGNLTVFFFYGEECAHCHTVMPFVINLTKKYPDVEFQILEIWHNPQNYALYSKMNAELKNTYDGIPEVIVGDTILFGERDIPAKLEMTILEKIKKKN